MVQDWPWESLGSLAAAFAGTIWAIYTFINERREDRRWKQVEFLLDLNQRFFDDIEIRDCIRRLDNEHQHKELERIFQSERASLKRDEIQVLEKFRSLFQFLDNLYRCFAMKTLSLDQINLFGWYLYRINSVAFLRNHCREHGFNNVIVLAEKLERYAYARST